MGPAEDGAKPERASCILTMVDHCIKFLVTGPLGEIMARAATEAFWSYFVQPYGYPTKVLIDHGMYRTCALCTATTSEGQQPTTHKTMASTSEPARHCSRAEEPGRGVVERSVSYLPELKLRIEQHGAPPF
ncbi:unnamed protein product [Caretta caretta]